MELKAVLARKHVRLCDVVSVSDGLIFGYEYGRGWEVSAVVEGASPDGSAIPVCVSGAGSMSEHSLVEHSEAWRRGLQAAVPAFDLDHVNAILRLGRYPLALRHLWCGVGWSLVQAQRL